MSYNVLTMVNVHMYTLTSIPCILRRGASAHPFPHPRLTDNPTLSTLCLGDKIML